MKRILFPTDLSEMTRHALDHAVHISKSTGAELTLVNAFDLEYMYGGVPKHSYEQMRDESLEKLETFKKSVQEREGTEFPIECFASYGPAVSSIEEVAEHLNVDLIVMATNGVSGLKEFFLGSHTERVLEKLDRPLLVIPEEHEFKPYQHALFASDLTRPPKEHLTLLMDLLQADEGEIHLVNVGEREEKKDMEKAVERFKEEHIYDDVSHRWEFVENKDVLKGIESYIDAHPEIGLLVMTARERRDWLERFVSPRLTQKVVHHPFLPTLMLKH